MNGAIVEVLLKQLGINPAELGAMVNNAKTMAETELNKLHKRLSDIEQVQLNLSQLVCELKNSLDSLHTMMRESRSDIIPAGATDGN